MKKGGHLSRVAASMIVLAALAVGCSHQAARPATAVNVRLRNFRVEMPRRLHAGLTRLEISSAGPTMHELVVAATHLAVDKLPMAPDGTVDDRTDTPGVRVLGEAEGIDIGDHTALTVRLAPGHYVMFCNMEGHYQAGMTTDVTVV